MPVLFRSPLAAPKMRVNVYTVTMPQELRKTARASPGNAGHAKYFATRMMK